MSKEKPVMKTAVFGGFKKSDVLTYIENLQNETEDIREQLQNKREESIELKKQIDELSIRLESLSLVNDKLEAKEKEVNELSVNLQVAIKERDEALKKVAEYDAKSDKLKKAEKQIGAAYLDARRYSDDLVDDAKMRAKDIGAIASQSVKREAGEIEELLKEVDSLSRKFNSSLEQLHKDVYSLSSKLNSSASNLLNIHTEIAGLDGEVIKIDSDLPEDAVGVYETNDDSGITYISYEPHTEFNSDLNIRPDDME